jgi:hypothetical protein
VKQTRRRSISEEVKRRFPRFIVSSIAALIFWGISVVAPAIFGDSVVPGINVSASWLVWVTSMLIMLIFLIRVLADGLVLADILTDAILKRLGAKEERSWKRAARDFIYIIIAVLLAAAALPYLSSVQEIGGLLAAAVSLVTLAFVILLIYDMGRILYKIIEKKTESVADWLSGERNKEKRKR